MTIRGRGKLKWQPASFLPLAFEMQREMFKDQARQERPILDEYQLEEFDSWIAYRMESNQTVKLIVWHSLMWSGWLSLINVLFFMLHCIECCLL